MGNLRIRRFQITKFKSLLDVTVQHLGNISVFIGKNNSGKTSLFQAFKFFIAEDPNRNVLSDCQHLVSGGLGAEAMKDLTLEVEIELSERERHKYILQFFGEPKQTLDQVLSTGFLRYFKVQVDTAAVSEEATQVGKARGLAKVLIRKIAVSLD